MCLASFDHTCRAWLWVTVLSHCFWLIILRQKGMQNSPASGKMSGYYWQVLYILWWMLMVRMVGKGRADD